VPAQAQDTATLIADSLEITGDTRLIADGNVEVFYKGRRLTAERIVFDQATDRLEITGPIVLTDDSGDSVILASQAEMQADLTEGILTSARLVLNRQLQLRRTRSCGSAGATPRCKVGCGFVLQGLRGRSRRRLWEIRARRVVHDEQERQIYFDNAVFRLGRHSGLLHPPPADTRPLAGPGEPGS
jgi:LPS-assembly protein